MTSQVRVEKQLRSAQPEASQPRMTGHVKTSSRSRTLPIRIPFSLQDICFGGSNGPFDVATLSNFLAKVNGHRLVGCPDIENSRTGNH